MVISEVFKKVLVGLYRSKKGVSFREGKELTPIANLIKRILPKENDYGDEEEEKKEIEKKKRRKNRS